MKITQKNRPFKNVMRQRKIKDLDKKIAQFSALIADEPDKNRGIWRKVFNAEPGSKIFAEVGSGKGRFIIKTAINNPENYYIGIEGQESVFYRALQKACAGPEVSKFDLAELALKSGPDKAPKNLRFVLDYVTGPEFFFAPGELDGIFLNFCDPWPKARQEKRRLTSPEKLKIFSDALAPGSSIRFKTDNEALFRYSLEKMKETDSLKLWACEEDLHGSSYGEKNIETEYELKFVNLLRKIYYIEVRKDYERRKNESIITERKPERKGQYVDSPE